MTAYLLLLAACALALAVSRVLLLSREIDKKDGLISELTAFIEKSDPADFSHWEEKRLLLDKAKTGGLS